ncbi:hypothetical protein K503DRAFT_865778 [Rhizopogon vinicolor AM-OR11-026]|uniref:Sacsin/Nov domain-containing protein n=1 Tax=Rhizopogon vinicolor AM-OR11-026 TaxID=1314800 RepID=A0A1B7N266_9AGAM|nr:hypothetical protein K503DRAFT_865778 [Rhizopogon vinicolor AM-OR11-026]
MHEEVAVEVNQRDLVDKVLARYPEEFTVFRELLQNADDAWAKSFEIVFQKSHVDKYASNGTKPDLDSVKVCKWLVKNNGAAFEENDWKRLTKIAEGNPDERKIGAFGVGFYSVFSVTDKPVVKSSGKMVSLYYKDGGDKLYVKAEKCTCDNWTVIEMELKHESVIPRIFELTRFLVTSMTFLVNVERVTIFLDNIELSRVIKSRELDQSITIPKHMVTTSRDGTMSIDSVKLISQEVRVVFPENLVGAPKKSTVRADLEESERNPTKSRTFFSTKTEEEVTSKPNGKVVAPRYPGAASEASLKGGAEFSTKCSIYSANVSVSAKGDLEAGLKFATKKKPPKSFSFEMVFFNKEEHDKQTREEDDSSGFGSVFRGPQGFCPRLQGEHAARIFIGQSTAQTTGTVCHMSGRFIPTVERGSIDLANGHVAKWNKEVLYVGGFLARVAYDLEMSKIHDAWPKVGNAVATELALYTMKSFTFHPSTPDSKVSIIIKDAFFDSSRTHDFPLLSDKGIRHTKDIRIYHVDFAPFMQNTPILPVALRPEIAIMVGDLPEKLRVRPYTFNDVVRELESRCLSESEMAACLRWWTNTFGSHGPLSEDQKKRRNELLKAGKALSGGKQINLSVIKTFIEGRMLNVRNPDDPLPEDTIPPALIQGLNNPLRIREALGWQEMPIAHWLLHLRDGNLDQTHSITRTPNFAFHTLTVLSNLWYGLQEESHFEIKGILEDVACIPTNSSNRSYMHRPNEAYFPEADVFRDLPVVRQELLSDPRMVNMLEFLGVQKRCDIETFKSKAMKDDRWDAIDLARYLLSSMDYAHHVMQLELFPCSDGKRRCIRDVFAATDINRRLRLPVVNCEYWDSSYEAQFLVRFGLREYPTIEELIGIASLPSESDLLARQTAFAYLCGPQYEAKLEKEFDPSKFASYAFIPGIRNDKPCLIPHEEVFSDPDWRLFGFGRLTSQDKKIIAKLKIRERPTATTLFQVLKSNPPKDQSMAAKWFGFLAAKGVFSAGEFDKIADLPIVPVSKSASEEQGLEYVTPRECFLKSKSDPENPFYQRLFKFVDFGSNANAFLRACGVKERPECIDILKVLLENPKMFLETAGDSEKYLAELRMIAVGHKSLPRLLVERMRKTSIYLGFRRRRCPEESDDYKLCRVDDVLVADDMESCRTFGSCIFIAPQEELLEKFYSEMGVKSLSSCIQYTVNPSKELQRSSNADHLRKSITEKIPIFLHEFDEQRFRKGMRVLRWDDDTQFFVRACGQLRVTKRLEFVHATGVHGQGQYNTELTAETQRQKDREHVLWIKDPKADSYDIAAALCRLLFSTYKKNDVLSLMTILDTPIDVLERRGYDVQRILKEYEDNLRKNEPGKNITDDPKAQNTAPSPHDGPPAAARTVVPKKFAKWLHWLRKDPKLGEVKQSDIAESIKKVNEVMNAEGGKDDKHISNREQVGGGKKQKNVGYCDEKKVAENDLEECEDKQVGQIKVWKLRGTVTDIPPKEREAFGKIISDLAQVFGVNQTRCHVFWHTTDSSLMGFNRNDQIFFGLEHYIRNHSDKKVAPGQAYIDWQVLARSPSSPVLLIPRRYYIMAHEMAHVQTPYHDEHHELLFAALTTQYLTGLHNLPAVRQMFNCGPSSS